MGWPKGKPRGSRSNGRRTEIDLETLIEDGGVEPIQAEQQDDEESDIVLIDSEGIYGLRTYKYGYELHVRRKYKKDTVVEIKGVGNNETRQILYKAGDFGPWQFSARPFHGKLGTLLTAVHEMMIKDKIAESLTIKNLADVIKESEKRILQVVS